MSVLDFEHTDWAAVSLSDRSAGLLMGERRSNKTVKAKKVKVSNEVRAELRELAVNAIDRLTASQAIPFSETQLLEEDEYFSRSLLVDAEGSGDDEDKALGSLLTAVADAVRSTSSLTTDELLDAAFPFYVVTLEDTEGNTIAFVKKQRAFKVGRKGKILLRYADGLEKLDDPIFAMAYDFDLVIYNGRISIWDVDSFFSMFTDVAELQNAVPKFVHSLVEQVPLTFSPETIANIGVAGTKGARVAQQIRRLSKGAWLSQITDSRMQAALSDIDHLQHSMVVQGNQVSVGLEDIPTFLNILEQNIWKGRFDDQPRRSQASRPLV